MNIIKRFLRKLYAKRTGRTCARCAYNRNGQCRRTYEQYMSCWHSITRPGFTRKRKRKAPAAPAEFPTPAPLTPEQVHQMALIKDTLEKAGQTAKDGGLLDNEYN